MNTGKTPVRSAHGLPAMDYFHADRRPVWRRSPGPDAFLRRAIPVHGLRPADLPGKPARHRDLPLGPRIETLSHGLPPAGPALDAGRCQRKARLAYPCGVGPAAHHPGEDAVRRRRTGVGPDQYRLRPGLDDHRSVPVGLSVGALPHHQGGGEDAHAARPAGQHSEFYPHLGWQAARRSCPRYALAGSRSHLRRGSWLRRLCPPLCVAPSRGLLRHACQVEHRCSSRLFGADGSLDRIICDQTISLDGFYTRQDYPELLRRIRFKDPESGKTLVFITNNFSLPAATICALYKSRWQVELFFKWIKQHLRIKQFYGTSENAVKTQIWIAVSVYVLVAIVKKRLDLDASLYTLLQILSVTLFEKMPIHQALAGDENRCNASQITNQLNLFDF